MTRTMRPLCLLLVLMVAACAGQSPRLAAGGDKSISIGEAAMDAGMPEVALRLAAEELGRNPRNAAALAQQGDAYRTLGRATAAEASYARALGIDPDNTRARIGQAMLLLRTDPARAEASLAHVVAQGPREVTGQVTGQVTALIGLGIARDLLGRHAQAQAAYRQALALSPDNRAVQADLGLSLALSGDGTGAVAILRPLAAEPQAGRRVKDNLAVALAAAGRTDEARSILRQEMSDDDADRTVAAYRTLF
jgi:Flp pilus assembly protein TadD